MSPASSPPALRPGVRRGSAHSRLLVVGGCCHDYEKQKDLLTKGISARANVEWTIAYDPDRTTSHLNPIYHNPDWSKGYDVVVHDECSVRRQGPEGHRQHSRPPPRRAAGRCPPLRHALLPQRRLARRKPRRGSSSPACNTIGHGSQIAHLRDLSRSDRIPSSARCRIGRPSTKNSITTTPAILLPTATALATGEQVTTDKDGQQVTTKTIVAWTNTYNGKTRVFATTLGHNNETVGDPRYLDLVTRGLLWSVDKLDDAHLKPAKQVLLDK